MIELTTKHCLNKKCSRQFKVMEKDPQKFCSAGCDYEINALTPKEKSVHLWARQSIKKKKMSKKESVVEDYHKELANGLVNRKLKESL